MAGTSPAMTMWMDRGCRKAVASRADDPHIRAGGAARKGRPGGTRPNPVMTRSVNAFGKGAA
jgi:hypothetical protein